MKIKFETKALAEGLKAVLPIVSRQQTLPMLQFLKIDAHADHADITASDLVTEATARVDCVGEEGSLCISAQRLHTAVQFAGEEITIAPAKVRATVTSGSSKHVIATLPAADFPMSKIDDEKIAELEDDELHEMLERVHFTSGVNDVRYYLNGVLLQRKDGMLAAVASDGYGAARCLKRSEGPDFNIIIGIDPLNKILKNGFDAIEIFNAGARFRSERVVYTTRRVDAAYPDWTRLFPTKDASTPVTVDRAKLIEALRVVASLPAKVPVAQLQSTKGNLMLRASTQAEQEEVECSIAAEGGAMDGAYKPAQLAAFADHVSAEKITLGFEGSGQPLQLNEDMEAYSWVAVVMPMRV